MPESQLEMLRRIVREGDERIAEQHRLINEMGARHEPLGSSLLLLAHMMSTQARHRELLAREEREAALSRSSFAATSEEFEPRTADG